MRLEHLLSGAPKKGDPPPNGDFKDRKKIKDKRLNQVLFTSCKVRFIYIKKEKEEAG